VPVAFVETPPVALARRPLTEADAIDLWLMRWLRLRRKDILARYDCDPRRIYEVWEEKRFPGSREKALELLRARYPGVDARVDVGPHRRLPLRSADPAQLSLF
jgi:hypothetical protein